MPRLFEMPRDGSVVKRIRARMRLALLLGWKATTHIQIAAARWQPESRANCHPYRNFMVEFRIETKGWRPLRNKLEGKSRCSRGTLSDWIWEWARDNNLFRDSNKPLQFVTPPMDRDLGCADPLITSAGSVASSLSSTKKFILKAKDVFKPHANALANAQDLLKGTKLKSYVQWSTFDENTVPKDPFAFASSGAPCKEIAARLGLGPQAQQPSTLLWLFRYRLPSGMRTAIPSVLEGYARPEQDWNPNFRIADNPKALWGVTHPDRPWRFRDGRPELVHAGVDGEFLTDGIERLG